MRFLPVGTDALLVEVGDVGEATALFAEARRRAVDAVDVVPAARTVLFDGVPDVERLAADIGSWSLPADLPPSEHPRVEVPTVYDGPDLAVVAEHWKMTPREVVETHVAGDLVVAFCGFAPGFAYCTGLPEGLTVPRRDSPRPSVPPGSVALADAFTGVYPSASPGGWQLIGRTDLTLWDESRDPPATLAPGTRVRFVEVSTSSTDGVSTSSTDGVSTSSTDGVVP